MSILIENLESRRFLSASLIDGVLVVRGTNGSDEIEVDLRDNGQLKVEINEDEQRFDYSDITRFVIRALDGNDQVEFNDRNSITKQARILGGDGRDTLEAAEGDDVLYGGDNNDHLDGREGNDTLRGEAGNDVLEGKAGHDKLLGGAGKDFLQGAGGRDRLFGEGGQDDLEGGSAADRIFGGGSNDDFDNSDDDSEIRDRDSDDDGPNTLIALL